MFLSEKILRVQLLANLFVFYSSHREVNSMTGIKAIYHLIESR
jgi:hypothetical protein